MEQSAITIDAPLSLYTDSVRPEWIDYNGHMNVAYYVLLVDRAMDVFFNFVGVGRDYVKAENKSLFAIDSRIVYLRELIVGAPVRCTSQLFGFDAKR
jgi:acyl-CoA thioester hydrolase